MKYADQLKVLSLTLLAVCLTGCQQSDLPDIEWSMQKIAEGGASLTLGSSTGLMEDHIVLVTGGFQEITAYISTSGSDSYESWREVTIDDGTVTEQEIISAGGSLMTCYAPIRKGLKCAELEIDENTQDYRWSKYMIESYSHMSPNIDSTTVNGRPIILYMLIDNSQEPSKLKLAVANKGHPKASSDWDIHLVRKFYGDVGRLNYMVANVGGTPAVSYYYSDDNKLKYAYPSGGSSSSYSHWKSVTAVEEVPNQEHRLLGTGGKPLLIYHQGNEETGGPIAVAHSDTRQPKSSINWSSYILEKDSSAYIRILKHQHEITLLYQHVGEKAQEALKGNSKEFNPVRMARSRNRKLTSLDDWQIEEIPGVTAITLGEPLRLGESKIALPFVGSVYWENEQKKMSELLDFTSNLAIGEFQDAD